MPLNKIMLLSPSEMYDAKVRLMGQSLRGNSKVATASNRVLRHLKNAKRVYEWPGRGLTDKKLNPRKVRYGVELTPNDVTMVHNALSIRDIDRELRRIGPYRKKAESRFEERSSAHKAYGKSRGIKSAKKRKGGR